MTKTLLSMLLAGTIALTSVTAPTAARADTDDVAKAIAALIALGVIAKAIDDRNDRKRASRNQQYYDPPIRKNKPRRNVKAIPSECVFRLDTRERGVRNVIGPRCVERRAPYVNLPNACRVTAWTRHGWRPAYVRGCLKKRGFYFT